MIKCLYNYIFFFKINVGLDANQLLNLNNYNYGFGSAAANLEYSILSNMLGSPMNQILDTPSVGTPSTSASSSNIWQSSAAANLSNTIQQYNTSVNNLNSNNSSSNNNNNNNTIINATPTSFNNNTPDTQSTSTSMHNIAPLSTNSGPDTVLYSPDQNSIGSPYVNNSNTTPQTTTTNNNNNNARMSSLSSYGEGAVVANVESPGATLAQVRRRNQLVTPEMVYSRATKPFSYADGYHYLINYVQQK